MASEVYFPFKFCICNLYLPPSLKSTRRDILHILQQLPKAFLLIGDFNAHNPIRCSISCDRKAKILKSLLNDLNLSILNKPNTHMLVVHFPLWTWVYQPLIYTIVLHDDLCCSDHFPISISNFFPYWRRRKWTIGYQNVLDLKVINDLDNVDDQSSLITNCRCSFSCIS